MSPLEWLMAWYAHHCDGDWEHQYGVSIETLDNPGWTITIDLNGTPLEGRQFATLENNIDSDISWWACRLEGQQWRAACGPGDLGKVIDIFRSWAIPETPTQS